MTVGELYPKSSKPVGNAPKTATIQTSGKRNEPRPQLYSILIMRIALAAIIVICGANLLIELLDSSMVDVIKERNETIQRQIDQM